MTRERKTKADRTEEILDAALAVFTAKGYKNTTMSDIVEKTGMSRGGVYHYYQATSDMLFDLLLRCNERRVQLIKNQISEVSDYFNSQDEMLDAVADSIVEKILTENDFSKLYAMLLEEKKHDEKLNRLYENLVEVSVEQIRAVFVLPEALPPDSSRFAFLSEFINSMILSGEVLAWRPLMQKERKLLKSMIKLILE